MPEPQESDCSPCSQSYGITGNILGLGFGLGLGLELGIGRVPTYLQSVQ